VELIMTKGNLTDWNPERDLSVLLDALTEELLTASERDLAAWIGEMGKEPQEMVLETRRLVAAADTGLAVPPVLNFVDRGLRAFVARNH
jgi:hypothetical protein